MKHFACALCHATDIPRSRVKRDLCEDCPPRLAARGGRVLDAYIVAIRDVRKEV
jgi:hypothetical protein